MSKYLQLNKEEQKIVSDLSKNAIRRAFNELSELSSIQIQELKQEFFREYTRLEAEKIFLQKEADGLRTDLKGWQEKAFRNNTLGK